MVQSFSSDDLLAEENLYIFQPGFQIHLVCLYFNIVRGVLEGATNSHVFKCLLPHLKVDKIPSAQESIQTLSKSF